jgi:sulfate permease, SulP family
MTATIVDDLTDTGSDKNRECKGQGVANIGSGLLGGMAGCAMIGQSVINVKSGGVRGRLSTLSAGVLLLLMVVFSATGWADPDGRAGRGDDHGVDRHLQLESLRNLRKHPPSSSIVMLSTVVVVVATHNLAYGVFVGVLRRPCSSPTRWPSTSM